MCLSPSDHELLPGRQWQSSHYHMDWPSWILAHTLTFPLITRNTGLCSCWKHLYSGFHVSSTQGLCTEIYLPPCSIPFSFCILFHIQKLHTAFLWPGCSSTYSWVSCSLSQHSLKVMRACWLHFLSSHFIFNPHTFLHPSHSTKIVLARSMAASTLPNPKTTFFAFILAC